MNTFLGISFEMNSLQTIEIKRRNYTNTFVRKIKINNLAENIYQNDFIKNNSQYKYHLK